MSLNAPAELMEWAQLETMSSDISPMSFLTAWEMAKNLERLTPVPDGQDAMLLAFLIDPVRNRFVEDENTLPPYDVDYVTSALYEYLRQPIPYVYRLWPSGSQLVFSLCYSWVHGDLNSPSMFAAVLYPPHFCSYCGDVLRMSGLERAKHYDLHIGLGHSSDLCGACGGPFHFEQWRKNISGRAICPMHPDTQKQRQHDIAQRKTVELPAYIPPGEHTCAPDPSPHLSHRCVTCGVFLKTTSSPDINQPVGSV